MTDINDVFANATRVTKTVPLCLKGDLQAEWEDLERQRQAALAKPRSDSLAGDNGEVRAITELMESVREQMEANVVPFRIEGLPKRKWSNLVAQHKPRPQDEEAGLDYNAETLPVVALAACCVDPKMSVEQAERLVDETLTQGQWEQLWWTVLQANNKKVDIPKSVSGSA
ncbi:hypothetical protein [Microbispora sp. CA-102843]|uniref:hypothetical protein n=1 Tax=Microbispora sp. CA-102843 TaxID=3239952 RepID=UPI003D918658